MADLAAMNKLATWMMGVALAGAGCGPDDSAAPTGGTGSPGTVTVTASGITGVQGKVLVMFAYEGATPSAPPTSGLCVQIATDPFAMSDTIRDHKPGGMNPCDLETAAKTFAPGTYTLAIQVFAGGAQTPEKCARTTVNVDGNQTVASPALGACP